MLWMMLLPLLVIILVGVLMCLTDEDNFCPYCNGRLNQDGICPNDCDDFEEWEFYEDLVPGRDYLLEEEENNE